ncbi:MAG: glutaredoxin family protein [Candidatus Nanopelagicales bacterium]
MTRVVLVGKPDCHLCEQAELVVSRVCGDLGVEWETQSILDDPELADEFWESIPVVLIDGEEFCHWRVDPEALKQELA